jgi:hypothetical protein
MFNMIKKMKKLPVIILTILSVLLLLSLMACESGSTSSPTSSPTTKTSSASKLVFITQPSGGVSGVVFDTQPKVAIEDAEGNLVANYRGLIELTITAGTGDSEARLFGGTKTLATSSTVEFKNLNIDKAGTGYSLTVSSGNLAKAVSASFTILPGKPSKLSFTVQPSSGIAGMPLTPIQEVTVQDANGNKVPDFHGSVTLTATGYLDDTSENGQPIVQKMPVVLSGKTTINVDNGVARLTDVSINRLIAMRYSFTAVSESLQPATSDQFTLSAGAPAKLEVTVQPSGGTAGKPFETQPTVAIEDQYGNVVLTSRASITVSITPGTGTAGAVLSGTKTLVAEDALGGVAAFTNLSIDKAGSGYKLIAEASGIQSVQSQAFNVSAP